MKKALIFGLLVLIVLALAGCQAGPNEMENVKVDQQETAGFWLGLWHGFILPITFILSLFNHNVGVYELHNNGGWYNFGFVLGVMAVFGGGGRGTAATRRKQY